MPATSGQPVASIDISASASASANAGAGVGVGVGARRRVNACVHCHHKKIRCDLDPTAYRPCSSCASLDIPCRRRQRKQYASRKETPGTSRRTSPTAAAVAAAAASDAAAHTHSNAADAVNASTVVDFAATAANSNAIATSAVIIPGPSNRTSLPTPNAYETMQLLSSVPESVYCNTELMEGSDDWEPSVSVSTAPSAENQTVGSSTSRAGAAATEPFFSGDPHGYGYVLDICNAGNEPSTQHHFIPSTAASTMDKADLVYAEAKGCFAVMNSAVCEDFISAYFHYVHPMLPIVDIGDFLDKFWGKSPQPLSMLLLWSMFSVAASFVPEHTVRALKCEDRHELKKIMYNRAKCLYMLDHEQDSVVVIQSCLLIGYWYSNLHDRTQSWYWTGIAISTAQTIGLHRNPDAKRYNRLLSFKNRRLWRNLWWCCVLRDRWLAHGSGRPLRIKTSDHDMPFPDEECMLLPRDPSLYRRKPLLPPELSRFQFLFLGLLRLAVILGDIMESIYRLQQPQPPDNDLVSSLAQRLRSCFPETVPSASETKWTEFFTMYAQIHVEATTIALYRPFTTEMARPQRQQNPLLCSVADSSVRKAASQTNFLLDRMISADTLIFAGPTMVSLLIPAMTVHLHEVRSSDQFTKAWSHNRLDFCLLVLKHLERNYPAATLVHELFAHARDKNCVPFGLSRGQDDPTQPADIADEASGGQGSSDYDRWQYFAGSDPFLMPDLMLPTPTSQHLSSLNDLDEEVMASCLADNGASSLFAMDINSLFNVG